MSDALPKREPKLNRAWSGVSPKTPSRDDVAQHILDEHLAKLSDSSLSAADRAETQKSIETIQRYLKRIREQN
jgi:hypothetical protein